MKLLVIGSDGQLGTEYVRRADSLGYQTVEPAEKLDVADEASIARALDGLEFDVIVNTAAYHGYRAYADHSPQRHLAVNAHGPYYLGRYAERRGKTLLHFSTDYVFSGSSASRAGGFRETDRPEPANLYAASKLAGESLIAIATKRFYVCRVASLYGSRGCKAKKRSNFVDTVLARLSNGETMEVVDDIVMSPTSAISVVRKTAELITTGQFGLYHLAGSGSCSWYDLAVEIARHRGLPRDLLVPKPSRDVKHGVERGNNTALANANLIESGLADLPPWQTSLHEYLADGSEEGDGE